MARRRERRAMDRGWLSGGRAVLGVVFPLVDARGEGPSGSRASPGVVWWASMRRRVVWAGLLLVAIWGGLGLWAGRESAPDRVYRRAAAAYLSGQYEQGEAGLRRLGRLRPPARFDRLLRGIVGSALDRPAQAIGALA